MPNIACQTKKLFPVDFKDTQNKINIELQSLFHQVISYFVIKNYKNPIFMFLNGKLFRYPTTNSYNKGNLVFN